MADAKPVIIETKAENNFRLTPQELESHITPKSKLLILPFPNNPTGAVMRRSDLEAIAKIVENIIFLFCRTKFTASLHTAAKATFRLPKLRG